MGSWPGAARAAISLTYDDGLAEHLDAVPRALEARDLRGTFYIPGNAPLVHTRSGDFRALAAAGHELGNHSLFHPCRKDRPGMDWVPDPYDLATYDPRRIADELRTANLLLGLIDGRERRSYGATCCQTTIAGGDDMLPHIGGLFTAVRAGGGGGWWAPTGHGDGCPILPTTDGDGRTADAILADVDAAAAAGGWLVLMFHGVGPANHRLHIAVEEHERLLDALAARDDLHVAPVTAIAESLG